MAVAVKGDNFSLRVGPHPGEKNTLIVLQAANASLLVYLPGELNLHSKQRRHREEPRSSGVRVGEKQAGVGRGSSHVESGRRLAAKHTG